MSDRKINDADLLAYAAGELNPERARVVEAHLANHPDAAGLVALYRRVAKRVASDDSVAPSSAAIAKARGIFRRPATAARPGWLDRVDALIARLVFDSRVQPMAVRTTGLEDRLQLAFETDDLEVDLQAERIEPAPGQPRQDAWRLVGQILTEGEPGARPVAAVAAGTSEVIAETETDERLAFELTLAPGRYDLCFGQPGKTVVLPGIELE